MAPQGVATGTVVLNGRDVAIVQARAAGFVERVYAHAPGDVVAAGAPLADILVPEWAGAQTEYLALRRTGDVALAQAARQRLMLLGMPPASVERLERSNQPQLSYTVTAPSSGVIQELMVRKGMTVSVGMSLVRLNGLDTVWVDATLPEAQATAALPGQEATISTPAYPSDVFKEPAPCAYALSCPTRTRGSRPA
jgi:membrane fusion protein, copper/silver efflux system